MQWQCLGIIEAAALCDSTLHHSLKPAVWLIMKMERVWAPVKTSLLASGGDRFSNGERKKEQLNTTLVFWDQRKQTHTCNHAQMTHKPIQALSPPTYIPSPSLKNHQSQELHRHSSSSSSPTMLGKRRGKQAKMCVYTKTHLKRDMLANVKPGDKKSIYWPLEGEL